MRGGCRRCRRAADAPCGEGSKPSGEGADQGEGAPAVELPVEVEGHPAAVGERREGVTDLRIQEFGGEEEADEVGGDEPEEAVQLEGALGNGQ